MSASGEAITALAVSLAGGSDQVNSVTCGRDPVAFLHARVVSFQTTPSMLDQIPAASSLNIFCTLTSQVVRWRWYIPEFVAVGELTSDRGAGRPDVALGCSFQRAADKPNGETLRRLRHRFRPGCFAGGSRPAADTGAGNPMRWDSPLTLRMAWPRRMPIPSTPVSVPGTG